jgi:hypothetical protein
MQSILDVERNERTPHSSFPWTWFGFVFAVCFLIAETLPIFLELDETHNFVYVVIFVAGWFYWLFCVHRLHRILEELTIGTYPITTGQAVGYHIIPFFNFYWVIKWPMSFSEYLNDKGRVQIAAGGLLGFLVFLSFVLRFVDGAIALFGMFGVLTYMSAKLRKHVENLNGPAAGVLPPPPPDSKTLWLEAEQAKMQQPPPRDVNNSMK